MHLESQKLHSRALETSIDTVETCFEREIPYVSFNIGVKWALETIENERTYIILERFSS